MNSAIDRFFSEEVSKFTQQLEQFDRQIAADAEPTNEALLAEISQCFYSSLQTCSELEKELHGEDPVLLKELQAPIAMLFGPGSAKAGAWNARFPSRAATRATT